MKKQVLPSINVPMSEKTGDVSFPWYMYFKKVADAVFGTFRSVFHNDTLEGDGTEESPLGVSKKTLDSKVNKSGDTMSGELTVPELTVAGEEGALNVSVIGNTPTIASNNGIDVLAATTFDKAIKTNDSTTWDKASSVDLVRKAQVATALTQKQDVATALNYDNITNCITEIPQDIKLELADGALILKAGSKVYVPNGAGVFDAEIVNVDIPFALSVNNTYMLFKQQGKDIIDFIPKESAYSGPNISFGDGYGDYVFGYDTESNSCGLYENDGKSHYNLIRNESLPICIFTVSNGAISSIDQVFNGFGYIGSVVFTLPGVEGLVPYYRNSDGTMKNAQAISKSVYVYNVASPVNNYKYSLAFNGTLVPFYNNLVYDEQKNRNYTTNGVESSWANVGGVYFANGKISKFNVKETFHAVDYSDTEYMAHQVMPSNRSIDLTLGASGASYTAPADGWLVLNKLSSGTSYQFVQLYNTKNADRRIGASTTNNAYLCATMPLAKGDRVLVEYSATGVTKLFRFIYANGAK